MALHGTQGLLVDYAVLAAIALGTTGARGARPAAFARAAAWSLVGCLLVAALAPALAALASRAIGTTPDAWPGAACALLLTVAVGTTIGVRLTPRGAREGWVRGALLARAPHSAAPGGIQLAGIPVPPADETKHFKILGTTGTGKSTAIRALLQGAAARGDRAIVADAGGAYLEHFHDAARGDVLLNPFDARAPRWDPFGELVSPYDPDLLARALIGAGAPTEEAWRHYARVLLSALLRRLAAAGARELGELVRLLNTAPAAELRPLVEGSPAQPLLEAGNERMFGSVRAVATAATAALEHVCAQQAAAFAVRPFVREGRGWLFLPYGADQVASLQTLVSGWIRLAILEAMSGAAVDRRLWIVVDELDALGPIDGLKDALVRLRKYGGRCVLGWQSIAQVGAAYGAADAQTIVENCGNTLILRCSAGGEQGGTARFASALIGEREVLRETPAPAAPPFGPRRAAAAVPQHVIEPAVLPSEIEQLADFHGFVKLASGAAWREVLIAPPATGLTRPAAARAGSG